ncbi:YtfJ family protein [Duffyella gerundensis]|uniref:YtfJ family protein n=1 Tax=Duffyella TaxID=3026546 RepID=UPI003F6DA88E
MLFSVRSVRSLVIATLLLPFFASAHNFVVGERVAPMGIADRGELLEQQGKLSYQRWNSAQLTGKVRVVLYLAGRMSAKDENNAVIEAISAAKLPRDRYQTTTIINTDDAIPGSAIFVRNSIESSKKTSPWAQFVVDSLGAGQRAWQLKPGGSTVFVLDKTGAVRFAQEGALSPQQVQEVTALLHQLVS